MFGSHQLRFLCRPSSGVEGRQCGVPTLQRLCESAVARRMVEPRSALALLEFADAAGAQLLRQHSLAVSVQSTAVHHSANSSIEHFHWLPLKLGLLLDSCRVAFLSPDSQRQPLRCKYWCHRWCEGCWPL